MITAGTAFASSFRLSPLNTSRRNGRQLIKPSLAKKENIGGDRSQAGESAFPLRLSKAIIVRSAIAVFGLGFLDAGIAVAPRQNLFQSLVTTAAEQYSGDWSRIGAISKETEELLKSAAYFVTPLCLLLIVFISDGEKDL